MNMKLNQTMHVKTSSSKRVINQDSGTGLMDNDGNFGYLKEQDRLKQSNQLRLLIGIVVSTISNYVEYKEPILDENKQLDLIQKDFFFDNILQLMKRLILKSQSQAQKYVEQIVRVYFFNK